jgi:para-aminobenzoate synthetase component 1
MAIDSVIEEISSPPDPFTAFRRLQRFPYAFFLDSALPSGRLGRYSFVGCDPFLVLRHRSGYATLEWALGKEESFKSDPFETLDRLLKSFPALLPCPDSPFSSGAVGYLSYDLKDYIERLPRHSSDDMGIPDMMMGFYDTVLIYDNALSRCRISSSGLPSGSSKRARARAGELMERLRSGRVEDRSRYRASPAAPQSNCSRLEYMDMVRRAKEYIRRGDIYQVNLSQRFSAPVTMAAPELYGRLRELSPAPFAAYLDFGEVTILSSSPERFLMKRGDHLETRPIKGTRPRGLSREEDIERERELIASAKDGAEHVMIVDLERNDIGKVCEYGSVAPTESASIEKYANVFHMVSTVSGRLRSGTGAVDCLRSAFPGGSITGAPKVRAMEIIDALESVRRSIYTGAIGYIGFDANMDTSIAIRTFVIKGDRLYFQVGGGIVADSDPEEEYQETLDKAQGMMWALGADSQLETAPA